MKNQRKLSERPHAIKFDEPSLTKQSFKESCDINNIMSRYIKTGIVDHVAKHAPRFGEMTGLTFTEMEMAVASAKNMFEDLPAKARKFFDHDPAKFLDYVDNLDADSDLTELYDLGLMNKTQSVVEAAETLREPEIDPPEGPANEPESGNSSPD